ncbi:Eco57I restriction-modification methylase domain-containing protein [Winogradskyella echinorum]|uniref:site-specific DNA-methyltransferase (adenine-specific) n=1 Tax=Winogradskyella echinorum TaxID=538189 RepID=A0ABR6Y4Q0_9FLAO|nr:TaqI-like C-terminal specificity domain-containing protein [Winogradskyella echinorum]MBC3847722.1 Eco57I restriction-modification methylase domain-containing protein [Winogradskyella echinorum]MBC5752070.1 Eco57I restriction-modification methylase domain-containing protein [Winogradskyella echinorum]
MNKKELQNKLNQPYAQDNWKDVVEFVFPNVQILAMPQVIPIENEKVETFKKLGEVKLNDGKALALFELKLKENVNIIRNRVELNDIASKYIDQEQTHGVLSIFEQGKDDYRFTFSARASEYDEEVGDFKTKKTDTKRFTYVLGKNESCRTAAERFYQLSEKKNEADIAAIEHAFSVETLSKNFFKEYKQQYELFVNYLTQRPGYYTAVFKNDDKAIRDWVKLLLGRLVFIKFVQKKGWLGVPAEEAGWNNGNYRFLEDSFESFEHKDNFYSQFLNPLFFEGFDQPYRPNDIFELTGTKVPFLSGGLFDNEDPKTKTINFPQAYFEGLFEFLEKYNFTIDENDTAMDREVGIDPEMLGHIFENLLEDNKDKGAFYTPKEIVRYMCQESLKEYLKTYLQEHNQWTSDEAKQQELDNALHNFITKKEASHVIDLDATLAQALKDVKICDPAIGSGAFPMGLLNEIFQLVHNLYDASPDKVGAIWEMSTWQPDLVKLNIIQQSIYGVDIEKGAVEIARLRFWLSLVVDSEEPHALPHLDYKIVVGDSLVPKLDDKTVIEINWKAKEEDQGFFTGPKTEQKLKLLKEITQLQKDAFDPNCDEDTLALKIRNKKIELLIIQLEIMSEKQKIVKKPSIIDYQNKSKAQFKRDTEKYLETLGWSNHVKELEHAKTLDKVPLNFFDFKLDFPEVLNDEVATKYGFDIVIGNPPYYQIQKFDEKDKKDLQNANYSTFSRTGDIYCLFYEKGIELLKNKGVLSYITSNTWMRTKFGEKMRSYFIENSNPYKLLNFEDTKIFPSATVEVNIMFTRREDYDINLDAVAIKGDYVPKTSISKYFENKKITLKELTDDSWIIVDKKDYLIKEQIEKEGKPLSDWNINFYRGFLTGFNDAFFIDKNKKDELIDKDTSSQFIIKPLIRGREIKKYGYNYQNSYVIFPHNGYSIKNDKVSRIYVEQNYPAIYDHLLKYKDEHSELVEKDSKGKIQTLVNRADQGDHWTNLRNCAYVDVFDNEKIIWLSISDKPAFALDTNKMYVTAPAYIMTSHCNKYLLTMLNSKAMEWYLDKVSSSTGQGTNQWSKIFVEKLPIPELNSNKRKPFEILADYLTLINAPENHHLFENISSEIISRQFEDVVNMMAYELYFKKHMKEKKIDVLQYVDFKDISNVETFEEKRNIIQNAYYKLLEKDNPIRNRILLASTRSVDIIRRINETTH